MNTHLALIAAPLVLGFLARLVRRPQHTLTDIARTLRDLITLRMLLRDTNPDERADLLNAHRSWRTELSGQPQHAPHHRAQIRG